MKSTLRAIALVSIFAATAAMIPAVANADDSAEWIAKCVGDNSDQGQSDETIAVYCACMNEKMPDAEPLSVTEWEKKNPAEEKACSTTANWKN